ncbi:hypothetical protein ABT404_06460 [Streptomyces hyaluromycini]|uniref:Helicase XPB/Ssl2 N-terminal domain-containing protein n=1 Tax=Streptomyces hyaluromycini TaxID=1377993 RepID=A0ABV1WQH6_9ACTN
MNTDHTTLAERVAFFRRHLVDGEPEQLRAAYLAVPESGQPVVQGTTAAALALQWRQDNNGLFLPASLQPPAPIDVTAVYLTAQEILGAPLAPGTLIEHLQGLLVQDVLRFCAGVLNTARHSGLSTHDVDHYFSDQWFAPLTRRRVLNLLRDATRRLIAPQALMLLARSALEISPDSAPDHGADGPRVVGALLAVMQQLSEQTHHGSNVITDQPGDLGRELIANQHFHQPTSIAGILARYARRWLQLPAERSNEPGTIDLARAYEACTGLPLSDLAVVAAGMWALTSNTGILTADQLEKVPLPVDRITAVLDLISIDLPGMRQAVGAERPEGRTEWSFDPLQQWPVIRLPDGELLILERNGLIQRAFGWMPLFDIEFPPLEPGDPKKHKKFARQAKNTLAHFSEIYVSEVLHSITQDGTVRRVYDDLQLKQAFEAKGQRIADAAIDYPGTWLVIEVTTTRLRRAAVHGVSADVQVEDFDKLIEELDQIDATIAALRRDETALTGVPAPARRRYQPLLVLPEGFPVNPITLTVIRERARARGLLTAPDTDPIEIVDIDELEMVEAIQEESSGSLLDILHRKQSSGLRNAALRDYIILGQRLTPKPPARQRDLLDTALAPLVSRLPR